MDHPPPKVPDSFLHPGAAEPPLWTGKSHEGLPGKGNLKKLGAPCFRFFHLVIPKEKQNKGRKDILSDGKIKVK